MWAGLICGARVSHQPLGEPQVVNVYSCQQLQAAAVLDLSEVLRVKGATISCGARGSSRVA
jgi:hypothetical protein